MQAVEHERVPCSAVISVPRPSVRVEPLPFERTPFLRRFENLFQIFNLLRVKWPFRVMDPDSGSTSTSLEGLR